MGIKLLKRHQIDFKKYDLCIEKASNTIIYAYSWYLDIVSYKNWQVLVLDDYKAVMPLPFARIKRKLFVKMLAQPLFCQQLGVFYTKELKQATIDLFLKEYQKNKLFSYQFNHGNSPVLEKLTPKIEKVNYELNLNQSHDTIRLNYSKNLKRNLKKALKNDLSLTNTITVNQFLSFKKENTKHHIKKSQYTLMSSLLTQLIQLNKAQFYGVLKEERVVAIGFFIHANKRIIHLFSASTQKGKTLAAVAYLFDHLIRENAHTNTLFDFEGSMIPGVAQFFKSFGAVNNSYICHPC